MFGIVVYNIFLLEYAIRFIFIFKINTSKSLKKKLKKFNLIFFQLIHVFKIHKKHKLPIHIKQDLN
jgi:hypothetical protein